MSFELNRRLAAKRGPLRTSANIDPVTAGIIRGAMETICFEAATHLGRAASSPIINQSNERNACIIDAHGRLAGASIGTPHLTFVSGFTVRYGLENLEEFDWGPGDVFLGNDPDYGGGHLPDYNVYGPIYDDKGELLLVQCLQAHQGDTGGANPGGFTLGATDIYTEGLAIPCVKLVHRGEKRRDVIKLVERNNRFPAFHGDLAAMISGVQLASRLLQDLIRKWGAEAVKAAINYNIDLSERRFRDEVAKWRDGAYDATVYIDHDTMGTKDVKVYVNCTIKGDQLTVDLTGSDDRKSLVGVWNTFGNSRSYVMSQVANLVDPSITKNEGLFNAVDIICPENSIAQPPPNSPAALGSFHPACEITEAVCVALSKVVPERSAPQVYKIGMPPMVVGFDHNNQMWLDQGVDSRSMDASAVKGIDGWGSCPVSLGNLLLSQAEDAEPRVPVINLNRDMIMDSDGAGQWRGQPASINMKQILEPTTAMTWLVSAVHPLSGMCGGDNASPYKTRLMVGSKDELKVESTAHVKLPPGSITEYIHGGGAGFGDPLLRDPEAVKDDVLDEKVSVRKAREKYGVVFTGTVEEYDLAVEVAATEDLRANMKAARSAKVAAE